MADMKVNFAVISGCAKLIESQNNNIKNKMTDVDSKVRSLDAYWDSPAAQKAMNAYSSLKQSYSEPRYNAMNNFVNYLRQVIGEGYTNTEETNKSLADRFK